MKSNNITHHEDKFFKSVFKHFKDDALSRFGIEGKIKDTSFTDNIKISIEDLKMDFVFLMEDDTYVHLEFQTTLSKRDLARFLAYDANYFYTTGKRIKTYVIYTNDITYDKVETELDIGSAVYRIEPRCINSSDFDILVEELSTLNSIKDEDVVKVVTLPLCKSSKTYFEKIKISLDLSEKISNRADKYESQGYLFLLAHKFLESKELKEIERMIRMYEFGKALLIESKEEGIKEGIKESIKKCIKSGLDDKFILKTFDISKQELSDIKKDIPSQ